jgi:thiol-disulfide isomerase/thioredoxin
LSDKVTPITDATFHDEVLDLHLPAAVIFGADGCLPCEMVARALPEYAKRLEGRARIFTVDIGSSPSTSNWYNVRGVPTLVLIEHGVERQRVSGIPDIFGLLKRLANTPSL